MISIIGRKMNCVECYSLLHGIQAMPLTPPRLLLIINLSRSCESRNVERGSTIMLKAAQHMLYMSHSHLHLMSDHEI